MRVDVDRTLCEIHTQCVFVAPEVFRLTDDDELDYNETPEGDQSDAVEQAALACPVQAIRLIAS